MNKATLPMEASNSSSRFQVLFVDGHKITIHYAEKHDPPVLREIRDLLINSISSM